jgi:hypothetical protein
MSENIKLGDLVKDTITGLEGVTTGVTYWLYGCRRFVIQPREVKDGKPADTFVVDEPQLKVLKRGVIESPHALPGETKAPAVAPRHGPRNDPGRQADQKRA